MKEKKTVNVVNVALVCIDGGNKGMIPVQQRAETEIDPKTGVEKMQSNPYVLQLTFGGKVEDGEVFTQAIARECKEELGPDFAKGFDFPSLRWFYTADVEFKARRLKEYNYVGTLTTQQYDTIVLHSAAERMVWIKRLDLWLITPLDKLNKNQNPQTISVMFPDFLEALQRLYHDPQYAKFLV